MVLDLHIKHCAHRTNTFRVRGLGVMADRRSPAIASRTVRYATARTLRHALTGNDVIGAGRAC